MGHFGGHSLILTYHRLFRTLKADIYMPHTSTYTPNYPIFDTYKVSAPTGNASRSYSTKTCDLSMLGY